MGLRIFLVTMVVPGEPPSRFGPVWAFMVRAYEALTPSGDDEEEEDEQEK